MINDPIILRIKQHMEKVFEIENRMNDARDKMLATPEGKAFQAIKDEMDAHWESPEAKELENLAIAKVDEIVADETKPDFIRDMFREASVGIREHVARRERSQDPMKVDKIGNA